MILEPEIKINSVKNITNIKPQNEYKNFNKVERKRVTFKKEEKNYDVGFKNYFIISMFFLLGILLGSIYFRLVINNEENKEEIINKISMIENTKNITFKEKINEVLVKNIKLILISVVIGASAIGSPFLVLVCIYKGFSLAFTISALIVRYGVINGNLIAFKRLYPSNVFGVFALIVFTISSIKVTINVFKNKKDIRYELIRHSLITLSGIIFLFFSAILEVFLN